MRETLLQNQMVGFLIQPNDAHTQGTKDPIGVGTTTSSWDNVQDKTATFYPFRAKTALLNPDPAVFVTTLDEMASSTMFAETSRVVVDSKAGLPTMDLTIYATPKSSIAVFLTSLFDVQQTDDSTSNSVYPKTFNPKDTEISFTDNEGFQMTVVGYGYQDSATSVGDGFILENAVVNSLTMTAINKPGDATTRLMTFNLSLIGQKLTEGQYFLNSFSAKETYIFNQSNDTKDKFSLDLTFESGLSLTDVCWRQFEMKIDNKILTNCLTTDGYANGYKRANPEITFTIDLPHNEDTYTILQKLQSGDKFALSFINGYSSTEENYFSLESKYNILTAPVRATEGDYISQQLNAMALRSDGVGWSDMIVINDGYKWDSNTIPTAIA